MKLKDLVETKKYQTDKFFGHNYLDTYCNLFDHLSESVTDVLEIGVQKGHSLLLWRDLFINANVVGADVSTDKLVIDHENEDRITFFHGDAYNNKFISKNLSDRTFDVIIDDGSHLIQHMTWFVQNYSKLLKPNGILVVEDIAHFPHAEKLKNSLPKDLQSRAHVIDLRDIANRWDDVLLVVK